MKLNFKKLIFYVCVFGVVVQPFSSCVHKPEILPLTDTICFTEDVLPLIQSNCATSGCHDAATAEEGFVATGYSSIIKMVKSGDASNSKLYHVLTNVNSPEMMPPDAPLSLQQRTLIRLWIEQGALNTTCNPITIDPEPTDTVTNPIDTIPEPTDTITEPTDTIIDPTPHIPPCDSGVISFTDDVWPIINNNCVGCHNNVTSRGAIQLHNYSRISGVANIQSKGMSLLVGVIEQKPGFSKMPQGGKLDTCSIKKIAKWVEQGSMNN